MINKNNNKCSGPRPHNFQASGLAVAVALVCSPLWAGDTIEFDDGTTIDWSVTTSYGIGTRLGNPSGRLKLLVAGVYAVSYLIGLATIMMLNAWYGIPRFSIIIALFLTTCFNFFVMRYVSGLKFL